MSIDSCVDNLPEFLKPKLRLFLSVDIVGSTAFKQSSKEKDDKSKGIAPTWLTAITSFYREIERLFLQEWQTLTKDLESNHGWPKSDEPTLWKAAGDELIYTIRLKDHRHASLYTVAWKNASSKFRPEIKKFSNSLDLKLTAWIAGFPVLNSELILRPKASENFHKVDEGDAVIANFQLLEKYEESNTGLIKDFIGPSLDTGFRLASFATPRKFMISADLALMLSHSLVTPPDTSFPIGEVIFRYDEKRSLKGVLDGIPYPIFWIDNAPDDKLNKLEDQFSGNKSIGVSDLREYCLNYITQFNSERLIRPYIDSDKDIFFNKVPDSHNDQLRKLNDYWKNETEKRNIELESANSPDNGKIPATSDNKKHIKDLNEFKDLLQKNIKKSPDSK